MLNLLALPDWTPAWLPPVLLVLAVLFAIAFLLMPFSVFGVKGRLEAIESRLDDIQSEIRSLILRLPESRRRYEEIEPSYRPTARSPDAFADRPPIPPAPHAAMDAEPARTRPIRPRDDMDEMPDRRLGARREGWREAGRRDPRFD